MSMSSSILAVSMSRTVGSGIGLTSGVRSRGAEGAAGAPDDLHTRAKFAAVMRQSTLEALVIEALERVVTETETEAEEKR